MEFNMTARLIFLALLAVAGGLHAQTSAPAGIAPAATTMASAEACDVSRLPDDPYGHLVRYGKELTDRTVAYIGPEVKNAKMRFSGNNLACASCHE
jgi:thiosulfate dehydrogenase